MPDPFADAQVWFERARQHIDQYRVLAYGGAHEIWSIRQFQHPDGRLIYALCFDRTLLLRLKPVAGEAANALFQSLDNIIGVAARRAGIKRSINIAWPWEIETDPESTLPGAVRPAIGTRLQKMEKAGLPKPWLTFIENVFQGPALGLSHIDVVKEVSNSGKHWQLVPTESDVVAVSLVGPDGSQTIFDVPAKHFEEADSFVFYESHEPVTGPIQMMVGTRLVAPGKDFHPDPMAAFDYTARFVARAIEEARALWATLT